MVVQSSVETPVSPKDGETPAVAPTPRRRRKGCPPVRADGGGARSLRREGFAATRLDDVAARAGVSKGTLYLYFDSKEALFRRSSKKASCRRWPPPSSNWRNIRGRRPASCRRS